MNQILQALCRTILGYSEQIEWTQFADSDWQTLVAAAQSHGVVGLICARWDAAGWPTAPAFLRPALQRLRYLETAQTALIGQELPKLLVALAEVAPVVVLKGAALGSTLYSQAILRPLSDIDLLADQRDLASISSALTTLGYTEQPEMAAGINQLAEYHARFEGGPRQSIAVEVHWNLVAGRSDWRSPPMAWFWERTEPWPTLPEIRQLAPDAQLLYLAAHLMLQHGAVHPRLIWCYDLHLIISQRGDELDWPGLIEAAAEFRWAAALHAALQHTQSYFDTPISAAVLAALLAQIGPGEQAFLLQKAQAVQTLGMDQWLKMATLSWSARLRMAWSLLLPSRTYLRWRYQPHPAWMWPGCYPYHWFRMLREAAVTLRQLARQRRSADHADQQRPTGDLP